MSLDTLKISSALNLDDLLFVPDSSVLVVATRGKLGLFDVSTGKPLGSPLELSSEPLRWQSPTGESVLEHKVENIALFWDPAAGLHGLIEEPMGGMFHWRPDQSEPLEALQATPGRACFELAQGSSPKRVVLNVSPYGGCNADSVQRFELEGGKPVGPRMAVGEIVLALAESRDASWIAAAGKETVKLLRGDSGAITEVAKGLSYVSSLDFHPSLPLLAIASPRGTPPSRSSRPLGPCSIPCPRRPTR